MSEDLSHELTYGFLLRDIFREMSDIRSTLTDTAKSIGENTSQNTMILGLLEEMRDDIKGHAEDIEQANLQIQSHGARISALETSEIRQDLRMAELDNAIKNPDEGIYLTKAEVHGVRSALGSKQWVKRNSLQIVAALIMATVSLLGFYFTYIHPLHHAP